MHSRQLWWIAMPLVIVLVAVLVGGLYVRGGIAHPAQRARADAEAGYREWSGAFEQEATDRRSALEPVFGEPIGETWYVICSGITPGGPAPLAQSCTLSVQTSYAVSWTDPRAAVDEMLTALESGPWSRAPGELEEEPGGKVAEAGTNGTVYVYGPRSGPIPLKNLPPIDVFPDGVISQRTVELSDAPQGSGRVEIRRRVGISRTNIGCRPSLALECGTLLEEAAMPRIDGFS